MHQQWRYKVLVIRELALCEAKLNTEGEKGWELVAFSTEGTVGRAFFKRIDDGTHPGDHHDDHHEHHEEHPAAVPSNDAHLTPPSDNPVEISFSVVSRH